MREKGVCWSAKRVLQFLTMLGLVVGCASLLRSAKGGFTEEIFRGKDGYVAATRADLNEDGHLDLILVGYEKVGIEIYFGDGTGNWIFQRTLPQPRPGQTMPGRALAVVDLNHD